MNKKRIAFFIIVIIPFSPTYAMFTQTARVARPAVRKPMIRLPQRRPIQTSTHVPQITKTTTSVVATTTPQIPTRMPTQKDATWLPSNISTNLWSYWTALKNKIFGTKTTPQIATLPTFPVARKTTPQPAFAPSFVKTSEGMKASADMPPTIFARIDAIQSLPEAESALKNETKNTLNNITTKASISDTQWTNLIEKEQKAIHYIQENCFSQAHPDAQWDADIPEEISKKITFFLLSKNISPKSISVHYRDTIDIDPFGHDTISVVGPTILYQTDMQDEKNIITGYTPATITLHKQNIAKLTESQFEAKLQHTITHLKQAHTEQINLLSKAIGSERFAQYAQPYKQALEREADFLEPIKSAEVAKIVQHAFLDEAFDSAMKEVKVNREKHGLDNKETALIVCTPIEEGPAILSSIASFEDLATYLNNKKEEIYQQLATTQNGVDYNQIDNFKTAVNKDINYIKTVCDQTPLENIIHDTELSPFILEETKRLLKQAGINPNSVNIFSKTRLTQTNREKFIKLLKETNIPLPPEDEQGAIQWLESRLLRRNLGQLDTPASVTSPTLLEKNNLGETTGYIPAMIVFNQEIIPKESLESQIFTIAHEIHHLKENHSDFIYHLRLLRSSSYARESIEKSLYRLQEVEADIGAARQNPDIAKVVYKSYIQKTGINEPYLFEEPAPAGTRVYKTYTHPEFFERYHWAKKIVELHQKKSPQNQPIFAPEKE